MPNANWFNLNRSNTPLGCFADTRPVQPLLNYVNTKILAGSRSTAFLGRGDRANREPAGSEPSYGTKKEEKLLAVNGIAVLTDHAPTRNVSRNIID